MTEDTRTICETKCIERQTVLWCRKLLSLAFYSANEQSCFGSTKQLRAEQIFSRAHPLDYVSSYKILMLYKISHIIWSQKILQAARFSSCAK